MCNLTDKFAVKTYNVQQITEGGAEIRVQLAHKSFSDFLPFLNIFLGFHSRASILAIILDSPIFSIFILFRLVCFTCRLVALHVAG